MTTADDERFMRAALDACRRGVDAGQSPFGCAVVRDGHLLVAAHNTVRLDHDPSAHAEVNAIRLACKRLAAIELRGATVYATTEPCPMCFTAIHWAKCRRIVYAARIADAARFGFAELSIANTTMAEAGGSDIEIVGDVLRDESVAVFERWQRGGGEPY